MAPDIQKMIVVPVDGSDNVLRNLDYINVVFDSDHNLKVTLFYVVPRLPAILIEEAQKNGETLKQLKNLEEKKC